MSKIFTRNTGFIIIAISVMLGLFACARKDYYIETVSTDMTKPAPITTYRVVNFDGGAYVIYDLPKTENLLYVKANYDLDGGTKRPMETRVSYFSDTVRVEGFKAAGNYDVKLTVVSRANIESDPITVKVNPGKPVYQNVAESLSMNPDFQGVRILANNASQSTVGIVFLDDFLGALSVRQQNFTSLPNISYAVRGYDSIPKTFAAYVVDKWGNKSDTIFRVVKPLYEKTFNKGLFSLYALASETPIFGGGTYPARNMWDNNIATFWHTNNSPAVVPSLPVYFTFNMGILGKISRFRFVPRQGFPYTVHANARRFTLWGSSATTPGDFVVPAEGASEGTIIGDWENLGNYVYPDPPSGAPPSAATASDIAAFNAGVDYEVRFDAPKVRFIRFVVTDTWSPAQYSEGGELTLYGDDR